MRSASTGVPILLKFATMFFTHYITFAGSVLIFTHCMDLPLKKLVLISLWLSYRVILEIKYTELRSY